MASKALEVISNEAENILITENFSLESSIRTPKYFKREGLISYSKVSEGFLDILGEVSGKLRA